MNPKLMISIFAISISGATFGGTALAATSSSETTIERTNSVDVPVATSSSEQTTTQTTKRGLFGRKKSETTTTSRSVNDPAPVVTGTDYKSKTTVETQKSSY